MSLGNELQLWEQTPDVAVDEREYARLLGLPQESSLSSEIRTFQEWATQWYSNNGRPWIAFRSVSTLQIGEEAVLVDGIRLASRKLATILAEGSAEGAVVAAVSAGPEAEQEAGRQWDDDFPDRYFFLDTYASAVVEHLLEVTKNRLSAWAEDWNRMVLPHYSPGYHGWDLSDQRALIQLLSSDGTLPVDRLDVLESGCLRPKKSQLALFAIAPKTSANQEWKRLISCEMCSYNPCGYRRAPFRREQGERESGSSDEVEGQGKGRSSLTVPSGLRRRADYSIPERTLRRWAKRYLSLKWNADGGLEASFRYEGTTCANMGMALAVDLWVALGSMKQGYPIRQAASTPAADDSGCQYMCSALADFEGRARVLEKPPALLGEPLDAVLDWHPVIQRSGCFCTAGNRNHKWKVMFETLHYRLAHDEELS